MDSRLTRDEWLNNSPLPTHAIGNSLQPPLLFPDRAVRSHFPTVLHTGSGEPPASSIPFTDRSQNHISFRALYDQSWVLNHLLWDDFFFTPDTNSRIIWRDGLPDRDFHLTGTRMHVAGAFNVNSTSVNAWRALLHSFLDVEVPNTSGRPEAAPGVERIPFTRFVRPHGPAYSPAAGDRFDDFENYSGYRRLSPDEVDALAVEIVREVRERGPFLSLSDFVNRRLLRPEDDPQGHRLQGALQAAIERAGLNESQTHPADPASRITPDDFPGVHSNTGNPIFRGYDLEAASIASNHGAPGYFSQADLLARIGAVLTTRSDTFTLRALGTTPSGARAVCEIVVRRSGAYLDPGDPPERHPDQASALNQRFGRRFEVIRFRWLTEEEI